MFAEGIDKLSANAYLLCIETEHRRAYDMQHEIETTAPSHSSAAITKIAAIVDQIETEHSGCAIEVNVARSTVRVMAKCNGAALRDLVSDLDRAGFLE